MSLKTRDFDETCIDISTAIEKYSCQFMQEKYSREFEVTRIEKRMLITDTLILTMNPKDDKSLNFNITVNTEGEVKEQYVESLALHKLNLRLQETFASNGIDTAFSAMTLSQKSIGETDVNLTINDIISKYKIKQIYVIAIFKLSDVKGKKWDVADIIENYGKAENINIGVNGYILGDKYFDACKRDFFKKSPSVPTDLIKTYYRAQANFFIAVKDSVVIREDFKDGMENI